jgi:hypothetical protein
MFKYVTAVLDIALANRYHYYDLNGRIIQDGKNAIKQVDYLHFGVEVSYLYFCFLCHSPAVPIRK